MPAKTEISACNECASAYYTHTSAMAQLCPQCAHVLYGYKNCNHHFENGRCIHCHWDGSTSEFIKTIRSN